MEYLKTYEGFFNLKKKNDEYNDDDDAETLYNYAISSDRKGLSLKEAFKIGKKLVKINDFWIHPL